MRFKITPLFLNHISRQGVYHRANQIADVTLHTFNARAADFQREVLKPLEQWRPHSVYVCMVSWNRLKRLRKQFPDVPFVATVWSPPDLVNTCVVAAPPPRDSHPGSGLFPQVRVASRGAILHGGEGCRGKPHCRVSRCGP